MTKSISMLLVVAAGLSVGGCASLSVPSIGGKGKQTEVVHATLANPVMELISLWEPGDGRGLDNLPTRGFAGQLLFFTYKNPTPAMVEGNVTVYVFDQLGTDQEQSRPLWQHTFAPEEWNSLALQTNLGTAYQIFVPYTRKGQHEARCSLRVKLEPTDGGPPVYSKMANVVLPGSETELGTSSMTRSRIEPRRFDAQSHVAMDRATERPEQPQLRTSSVSLPGRKAARTETTARLHQLAQEMVRTQQGNSGIEQAAYFTEAAEPSPAMTDEPSTPSGGRYRLYR